ncbi:MAG: hypothetical protein A2X45_25150 [Lentisphaerae bacterium GWF2_50_93]|nr:MAG: hypothetical protein A2X45_25150 [Lentisphaerae bacterium GWF2_50_93]
MSISNPILSGFNPDPCICVVGGDFYIATSTFEWFPGVQIHHSKDLKHWRLITRPLNRISQLDLRGCRHSGGVWAPSLTYADGLFWLVYTNVRSLGGPFITDSPIFLVTTENIEGEWSEPVYLGANGFDPSLFHDGNGKKYLLNMQMGDLGGKRFDGITLQEYDHGKKKFAGDRIRIWDGTELGKTEGPHLYKKDGFYYLLTAEGGTSYDHAVSMARSKNLLGPYETDPANPMLTSANRPEVSLKSSGHGDLFQTPDGEWYMVHLCQRPLQKRGVPEKTWNQDKVAILGRETALQKVDWPKGEFPRLKNGGNSPYDEVDEPKLSAHAWEDSLRDDFNGPKLNMHFQTLREPADESWMSLKRRPGWLSLKGRNSLYSFFEQSFVARRLQHFKAYVETCLSFKPLHSKQDAGLIAYYDSQNYHYLRISHAGEGKIRISVVTSDGSPSLEKADFSIFEVATIDAPEKIYLKMSVDYADMNFFWSLDGEDWNRINKIIDSTNMGDRCSSISSFTGTFWGICCQDMTGDGIWADFDYFEYHPEI